MTNSYNSTTSTNTDDITQGVSGDTGSDGLADLTQIWRIRGQNPGNGWSSQAPIGTQGAEFAVSTVGYSSINVSFDWYATTQGEGKLQLEYTTDGTTWNNVAITVPAADTATTVHTNTTSANTIKGSYVQVSGQNWSPNLTATITDPNAANDPNFAIELVNASTGTDCVNTAGKALNNTSGNWRFDNVTISGTAQPAAPTVTSPTANPVGINTATLGGTVTSIGSQPVTQYGVVYSLTSTNNNPQLGGTGVSFVSAGSNPSINSPFTVQVSGLAGTSEYSYAAYATNSVGTSYSSVGTFTTQNANAPIVDTPTDTSITGTTATLGGTVETDGGAAISESGIVYALASNPNPLTIGSAGVTKVDTASPVDNGTSPMAFTVPVSGLSFNTAYVFAAFATNSSGTTYSSPATQFTTLAPPTVTTPTVTAVTGNAATLGGDVTSNGSAGTLTQSGVIYALTSNPQPLQLGSPGVSELDTGGTTGIFTVQATGLSATTSYTFEAYATSSVGTSYSTAASFTTPAPGVIAAWTFPTTAGAPDNSPAPTYGTGTATTLGMGSYPNANGPNTAASDDVLLSNGAVNPAFGENTWRVRGTPNNGWSLAAPQFSQGIELDTSTVGYSNIIFSFDWYSTTQGIRDLQVQYNTGTGWVNYQGPSPTGTFIATSDDFYNAGLSPVNPTIYINLSNVPGAANNPNLGIRLVSAYDSTGSLGNVFASATSTPNNVVPYNDTSGNWRFGNLIFYGNLTTTTTTVAATPAGGQNPHQPVTFTATVTPESDGPYPSGTVAFYDGNNQIGSTQPVSQVGTSDLGTANITLSSLSPGIHGDMTAQYTPAPGNGFLASGSSMNLVAGDPTDNPISYSINAPQATGVDVSPVEGQPFTGVVATFSDGIITDPTGFSASITWGDGHTTSTSDGNNDVVIAFAGTKNETNINGQIVPVSLFTVTGTNTYAAPGSYPMSITITDPHQQSANVAPTARVAYAPLHVNAGPIVNAVAGTPLNNQTVATVTDPGLVATLGSHANFNSQFSISINWGDNTPLDTTSGTVVYNSITQEFSVLGSHTYAQTGPYSISVAVTPLTLSVERIDSSDPTNLNLVGDENGDGLTDSPSPDFIDQYVIGAANQTAPLYTTSLPAVATTGGNEALTNSSYSISEGEMTLSTNGQYLVLGGYNDTVSAWAPQQTFSPASVLNRVIGTVDGNSDINTTTDLTDAYSGDNFRGVASTDGTQFWTAGHSSGASDDFVHYAQIDATTSTILTGPSGATNINTVEIFNGQLYEGVRSTSNSPAGIFQIGTGLPTTAGQSQNLFIQVPQSNPLDLGGTAKPVSPFGFWMTDLADNPDSINGVNVAYVADAEMGITRYDYYQAAGETSPQWNFSYYIDKTGTVFDVDYTVDSMGNVTTTSSWDPNNTGNDDVDPSKLGGIRELTGRVVDGQVQLFGVTGFGTIAQPSPGGSLVEVTDAAALTIPINGLNTTDSITTLATNPSSQTTDPSELTSVAFSPTAIVTNSAQVSPGSPTITSTASSAITLGTMAPTLSDSAVLANGENESGSLLFTLTGPGGFSYTQIVPISGNGTYMASDTLPTTGTVAGTYTWSVIYAGDANNNSAHDQGGAAEQTVVSAANPTITTTPSPNITLGTTAPTLSDSAVVADGYYETGSLVFTLTGPNGFTYTQSDPLTGNGTYTASTVLPTTGTVAGTYTWHVSYAGDANNNSATDNGAIGQLGDVFYLDFENHNLTQPAGLTGEPQPLMGNPAAPYLNSLMNPSSPNAAQTSWASNYYNVLYNNPAVSIHPSEPNYIWQEGGSNFGEIGNDDDPYANNGNPNPNLNNNVKLVAATGNNPANLSGLLQAAGISWKSYQEDIDLTPPSGGSVNQPSTWGGSQDVSSTVASQSEWTVPTSSMSGTSADYTNAYNGSHQYNFAVKHDGTLFYTDTNGGMLAAPNFSPSNPEAQYYAPLQQLATDLTNNTVARYNLITPDQYNEMHSSLNTNFTYDGVTYTHNTDQEAIAEGDNFLSIVVPEIMASQAYKNNGEIVIWFDESEGGNTTQFTLSEIIISPLAKGNAFDSTVVYTHSSDLKTLEEAFDVPAPGGGFLADANTPGTNDLANMYKPEQTVVSAANPTITSTASPAVAIGPAGPTLTDTAVLAGGYYETGSLVFTLSGPNGFSYSQTVPVSGNGTYTASDSLPTVGTAPGTYTWSVTYAGDANNNNAIDQGGTAEQTVVVGSGATVVGNSLYLVGGNSTNDKLDIDPAGRSDTGSTGISVQGKLAGAHINKTYSQAFTTIYIVGFGGNEQFNEAPSITIATVVTAGNGNDQVQLGNGNNTLTLGDGNDQVIVGDGKNQIQLGNGNDLVLAGNGDNLIVGGLGHHTILAGNGKNILIDGSVQLTGDVLEQVLSDWIASDVTDVAKIVSPAVTFNNSNANTLLAGKGSDWFWYTYGKDHTNRKPTDLLN
jgi:phosphatidylinositol-3-phosphatase